MDKQIQYRQIDYLRLFRLCKNLGFINRKRKMPSEYGADHSGSRNAGKRLLRALIKHLFPDLEVNSDYGAYFMVIPRDARDALAFVGSRAQDYFDAAGESGAEALRKYTEIRQSIEGHVNPVLPYEIKIFMVSQDRNSRYNTARRNGAVRKPQEDFYRCAKACIEFKRIWDENISFLISFAQEEVTRERERAEALRREREERRRRERERIEQERAEMAERERVRLEQLRNLERQAEEERQVRVQNAQSTFNSALQQFRRLRGENES